MIINPTKKTLPLFNKLPNVDDKMAGRRFSEANPFFSWHANYVNVMHKKVLFLVNDLTLMPVILVDINAERKKNLAVLIPDAIKKVFKSAGISSKKIDAYLALIGDIKINAGYNRFVTASTNLYLERAKYEVFQMDQPVERHMSVLLGKEIMRKAHSRDYVRPVDQLHAAFANELKINPVPDEMEAVAKAYIVNRTWQSLADFPRPESEMDEGEYQKAEANNQLVIDGFKDYLTQSEHLGLKAIHQHVSNIDLYLNGFLLFQFGPASAVTNYLVIGEFLYWLVDKGHFQSIAAITDALEAAENMADWANDWNDYR